MDWGAAHYESTAAELAPAADLAVRAAAVGADEQVLDVACGTGNAALAAAACGAAAVGIDSAERLLGVARTRAQEAGVRATFLTGDLEALPVDDASFDAALSVFGVIFARDAAAAAAELRRVVRPGGRIVLATWIDRGPLAGLMRASRAAAAEVAPAQPAPATSAAAHLDWGSVATLERLFPEARVTSEEHAIPFVADSPRAWIDRQDRDHPSWQALRAALPPVRYAQLLDELTALLAEGNEDPDAFRVSSPCLVARVDV